MMFIHRAPILKCVTRPWNWEKLERKSRWRERGREKDFHLSKSGF